MSQFKPRTKPFPKHLRKPEPLLSDAEFVTRALAARRRVFAQAKVGMEVFSDREITSSSMQTLMNQVMARIRWMAEVELPPEPTEAVPFGKAEQTLAQEFIGVWDSVKWPVHKKPGPKYTRPTPGQAQAVRDAIWKAM